MRFHHPIGITALVLLGCHADAPPTASPRQALAPIASDADAAEEATSSSAIELADAGEAVDASVTALNEPPPNPFQPGARWRGTMCGSGVMTPELRIAAVDAGATRGTLTFYAHCQNGAFSISGDFDSETHAATLRAGAWKRRPEPNFTKVDLVGEIDPATHAFVGTVPAHRCRTFPTNERAHALGWHADGGAIESFHFERVEDAGADDAHVDGPDASDTVVFDFGCKGSNPVWSSLRALAKSEPGDPQTKRILDAVLRRRFPGLDAGACAESRAPRIYDGARGSFSAPGAKEAIYLTDEGDCSAGSHCEDWGTMTLSLFANGALVAFGVISGSTTIENVRDLDGDGRDEIILTSSFFNQGSGESSAAVYQVGADGLTEVASFGEVLTVSVSGNDAEDLKNRTYGVLHALRSEGAPVRYRVETKRGACPRATHATR